jgi:hypothetical protein
MFRWFRRRRRDNDFLDGCDLAHGTRGVPDELVPWFVRYASTARSRDEADLLAGEWFNRGGR